jgi:hypothetical protein
MTLDPVRSDYLPLWKEVTTFQLGKQLRGEVMNQRFEAADALAAISDRQDRARRRARLPWWVYAGMFVLVAAGSAANDFVSVDGAKLIALLVLIAFVAILVITFATGSAPLGRLRGVQPRQSFVPRAFAAIAVLGGAVAWLVAHYGDRFTGHLGAYPNSVAGLLYGAVFTGLFALGQRLTTTK